MLLNRIGDIIGVFGLLISIVGFSFTLVSVARSKSAARRAEIAAQEARNAIEFTSTLSNVSAAIAVLEEIRRHHRANNVSVLPERYGALRKTLMTVRGRGQNLSSSQLSKIQSAMVTLQGFEKTIDLSAANNEAPELLAKNILAKNHLVSRTIDNLQIVLLELQSGAEGVRNGE